MSEIQVVTALGWVLNAVLVIIIFEQGTRHEKEKRELNRELETLTMHLNGHLRKANRNE